MSMFFTNALLSIEKTVEKAEPKERTAIIDEKIKKAQEKAIREDLKIKQAHEDLIEYNKEVKITLSPEKLQLIKEKISLIEQALIDAQKEKQLQKDALEKLTENKKKLIEMQNQLDKEATSTQSSDEIFAEKFQNCIKQKIYDLFHIPPQKPPKTIEEQVEELSASLKKLISYEKIYFTSSSKTTPEDWEKIRTNSLEAKPGESNFNDIYRSLIKKALEIQTKLEESTKKKVGAQSRAASINCSLPFFASEFVAQQAIEQLDEASSYDN